MDLAFPREARLRKRPEFLRVQEEGKRHSGSHLILLVARGGPGPTRLGITVSRKLGGAVVRNRVKRRLREVFRLHRSGFLDGFEVVVVARGSAVRVSWRQLEEDLLKLARSAGVAVGTGAPSAQRAPIRREPKPDSETIP